MATTLQARYTSNGLPEKDRGVLERLDKPGLEPLTMSNARLAKLPAADHESMLKVMKASVAKVQKAAGLPEKKPLHYMPAAF